MGKWLYFELCEQVWGGSPATEQTEGGIENADLWNDDITHGDRQENSFDDSQGNNPTQDTQKSSGDTGDSAGGHDNPGDDDNEEPLTTQQSVTSQESSGEAQSHQSNIQQQRQLLD